MSYENKYLAFVDILGFSSYVENGTNEEKVAQLFQFINNLSRVFDSEALRTTVSVFSDSIVFFSESLPSLIGAIWITEDHVKNELQRLLRGGICKGKASVSRGVLFGPAVVTAYKLSLKDHYSRVIIDKSVVDELGNEMVLDFFDDVDGTKCLNPFSMLIHSKTSFGPDGPQYPNGNLDDIFLSAIQSEREKVIASIKKNMGTDVVDKYLWRIRPFNYTCKFLSKDPGTIPMFEKLEYMPDHSFKENLMNCQISEKDYLL